MLVNGAKCVETPGGKIAEEDDSELGEESVALESTSDHNGVFLQMF